MRTLGEKGMPTVEVIFFQEVGGKTPPLIEWLDGLPEKARLKCLVRLRRLEDLGHELRRPEADYVRDGIYKLRASYQGVHYRMLYFFYGRSVVVLTHGVVREREVPTEDIDRALRAKDAFVRGPSSHTFRLER
jgi:phage-related protein